MGHDQPASSEARIERRFGRAAAERTKQISAIFSEFLQTSLVEGFGDSEDAKVFLGKWERFVGQVSDRGAIPGSYPKSESGYMDIAIEGTNALLAPEPSLQDKQAAIKMREALERKCGK